MNRTNILCTIGPASEKPTVLKAMMLAGMTAARLNLSHGTLVSHRRLIRTIRSVAKNLHREVPIIADLQGPKIRLGVLLDAGFMLKTGGAVVLTTRSASTDGAIPVTYSRLNKDLSQGQRIFIDDGLIELVVTNVKGTEIHAKVINGGKVTSHKGMNFPDTTLSLSSLTKKDEGDVVFAVEQRADWIALSFVTSPREVAKLRRLIKRALKKGQAAPRIFVKIEKHEAIKRFDELLACADGVIVGRGDLGIEIPAEDVPERQKEIVEKCQQAGKPVVIATQMLDSMIRNPRPTRAEVSDVANAVFDHVDWVMLSGETASGKYPVKAVEMMAKIVSEAEASGIDDLKCGL